MDSDFVGETPLVELGMVLDQRKESIVGSYCPRCGQYYRGHRTWNCGRCGKKGIQPLKEK